MARSVEIFLAPWQAADYTGLKVEVIYELLESGEIAGKKVQGRWIIRKSALDKWLDTEVYPDDLKNLKKKLASFNEKEAARILEQSQRKGE
jgi:excisionase family DNA binding protein